METISTFTMWGNKMKRIVTLVLFTLSLTAFSADDDPSKMYGLLVVASDGSQAVVYVQKTGGYEDKSKVIYDERISGPFPANMVIGAMKMSGKQLVVDNDMLAAQQKKSADAKAAADTQNSLKSADALILQGLSDKIVAGKATPDELQVFLVKKLGLK